MSFGGQLYHGGHHGLDVWSYIARLGVSMKGAGDDFFAEGDAVCAMRTCQYMTQVDIEVRGVHIVKMRGQPYLFLEMTFDEFFQV